MLLRKTQFQKILRGDIAKGDAKMENQHVGLVRCTNTTMNEQRLRFGKRKSWRKAS
jgi:hypothetical protein